VPRLKSAYKLLHENVCGGLGGWRGSCGKSEENGKRKGSANEAGRGVFINTSGHLAKGKLKTETAIEALFLTHTHTTPHARAKNTAESEKTSGFLMSQVANT